LTDETYIILFRGVGGATQLPTKPLREALTQAGFDNVATYINSGNAVVKSAKSRAKVIKEIAAICRSEFGFDKAVYALTRAEWLRLIQDNPFAHVATGNYLHAAVLEAEPEAGAAEALRAHAVDGEAIEVIGKVAYLHTPQGFGPSKFASRFDKGIGVPNTARNWNTVVKLMELADRTAD
jgi:uncharacterized protein (DUF1697 family)